MKSKFLSALLCPSSSLKWCCSKEEAPATTSTSTTSTLQISRSRAAVLDSLSDLPESETNRELSFSFLINNGSTENNSNIDDGVLKEELSCTAPVTVKSVTMKEKKMRRSKRVACSNSTASDGMFSYLCGPVSFTRSKSTPHPRYENRKANGVCENQFLACSSGRRKVHQC